MATTTNSKPHAVAIPLPFQGHIHPLLELSKKLVSAGFTVTFANTQANHKRMKGEGEGDVHLVSLEDGFAAEEVESIGDRIAKVCEPAMKAAIAQLLARLCEKGQPASLLVFDLRLQAALDLALEAGIASLALWTQSAAQFACNIFVPHQGYHIPADDSMLITCVEGVPPFPPHEIGALDLRHYLPPFVFDDYARKPFDRIHRPTWVALNTFQGLEATTLDTLQEKLGFKLLALGPLVNAPSFSVAKGISDFDDVHLHLKWLLGRPRASILYIAFGTIATLSEEQLEELVLGLEASRVPFLWVFRPDLCHNSKKYTMDSLSTRFEKQGLVVRWTSQWHILSHPSVGGFLTHCGWNSTLEGIMAGVPMLGWPFLVDQPLTARCIEEKWSIGLRFEANGALVSRIEVHKKVIELMEGVKGREMREKATTLSGEAKRALEEGGSSHKDFAILYKAMGVL